jgi:hypothetical protein
MVRVYGVKMLGTDQCGWKKLSWITFDDMSIKVIRISHGTSGEPAETANLAWSNNLKSLGHTRARSYDPDRRLDRNDTPG